jgi:predicted secreted protein
MSSDPPDDVVELRVGERHTVRLPGLGSAGYRWTPPAEGTEEGVEVRKGQASADAGAPGATGASSEEVFTIEAKQPGVAQVRFAQRRPWDPEDKPPAKEHVVELRVDDA